MNPTILPSVIGQAGYFNLGIATGQEEKLIILHLKTDLVTEGLDKYMQIYSHLDNVFSLLLTFSPVTKI